MRPPAGRKGINSALSTAPVNNSSPETFVPGSGLLGQCPAQLPVACLHPSSLNRVHNAPFSLRMLVPRTRASKGMAVGTGRF